jgi:hypothetical protein
MHGEAGSQETLKDAAKPEFSWLFGFLLPQKLPSDAAGGIFTAC